MAMEACERGFSYMPESRLDISLRLIEDEELERAWKVSRRQRAKEQEQKIWEEFVKEQDIVQNAYSEDPYQFLDELPESCLKELMELELQKLERESGTNSVENSSQEQEHPESGGGHLVTFSDKEKPEENIDVFHIYDDENEVSQSGGEGGGDGDGQDDIEEDTPESPSTVRERETEELAPSPGDKTPPRHTPAEVSQPAIPVKSTENVSNVIESSIYCARVKDIRLKIGEEMAHIITSLETCGVQSLERTELARRCRRAAEFCARFNRIYMYELQRQAHNIKRHVNQSLPLAVHTQFQSQMLRVVSLHQNMLQALQVIHKSFPATSCASECARALTSVCAFVRDVSALCAHIHTPRDFPAAGADLYNDELLPTCELLERAVQEHTTRVSHLLSATDVSNTLNANPSTTRSKKSKKGNVSKIGSKPWSTKDTDTRLSMYSLDTQRGNLHPKSSYSRANTSNSDSKGRRSPHGSANKQQSDKGPDKTNKKSSRRPLMRAPTSSAPRPKHVKDMEITTMVEAVKTCTSSRAVSRAASPRGRSREVTPREVTPREVTPRCKSKLTPSLYNSTPRNPSPKARWSPRTPAAHPCPGKTANSPRVKPHPGLSLKTMPQAKKSTTSIASDAVTNIAYTETPLTPVIKIQCAKKQAEIDQSTKSEKSDRSNKDRSKNGKKIHTNSKSSDRVYTDRSNNSESVHTDRSNNSERIHTDRSNNSERVHTDRSNNSERVHTDRSKYTERKKRHEKVYIRSPTSQRQKEEKMDTDIDMLSTKIHDEGSDNIEFCGVKELTENNDDYAKAYLKEVEDEKSVRSRSGAMSTRCDVSWLLRQLCSGDPASVSKEKVSGVKNAQLVCMRSGGSPPHQPTTPQLLRILEETIQKQAPKPMYECQKPPNTERFRLNFNIGESVSGRMFQYRTKFVQHMLASPLYANSAVGKPWEMIGGVSDAIIDEVLTSVAKEMQIKPALQHLYKSETH